MSPVDNNVTAIDTVAEGIDKVDISDSNNDDTSEEVTQQQTCATCGKEGNSDDMNTCNKCKMVKYCNAACKKKHRKKHKKACGRRVAELHEEALFKEPPPNEECTICMLPLPNEADQVSFQTCCGKVICNGCMYAMKMREGIGICAFCRTRRTTSNDEVIKELGLPHDWAEANELYRKSGELGCARAYHCLGRSYADGRGFEVDRNKANHYWELAAMNGDAQARVELGMSEWDKGNYHRAFKHYMIAAKAGDEKALEGVKAGYMDGIVTKDEYASTLRAHHDRQKEIKSDERDKAATFYNHPNFGEYPSRDIRETEV